MKRKNTLAALLILLILLGLGGCSSPKDEMKETIYRMEEEGSIYEVTLYSQGDEIKKQVNRFEFTYSALGFDSKEEAEMALAGSLDTFEDIKGITTEHEFSKDTFKDTLTLDYEIIDKDVLDELVYDEDYDETNYLSLKGASLMLEESGYVLVEDN